MYRPLRGSGQIITCLVSVELGLVPDRVDDRQESFERQSHDAVGRRNEHPPQRHLHNTDDTTTNISKPGFNNFVSHSCKE